MAGVPQPVRRLLEEPEAISDRDLTVMNGVALDKLAKYENWTERDEWNSPGHQDAVRQIAEMLSDGDGKLRPAVRLDGPRMSTPGVIDVEAEREGDG